MNIPTVLAVLEAVAIVFLLVELTNQKTLNRFLLKQSESQTETVKRMLNPQWRWLLYGEQIAAEAIQARPEATTDHPKTNVKLPRYNWAEVAAKATRMFSPEGIAEQKRKEHDEHIHAVTERIGANG